MIETNADEPDDDDPTGHPTPDLSGAYTDLIRGLKEQALPADALKQLGANFAKAAGIDRIASDLSHSAFPTSFIPDGGLHPELTSPALLDLPIDTSHHDTARNTERVAQSLEAQHEAVAQLVHLTASSLALTTEQREASERTERFSRRTTITSVVIGAASLAASIAAILVALLR